MRWHHGGPESTELRYYERIGLLPDPLRTPAGYRHYQDDEVRGAVVSMTKEKCAPCSTRSTVTPLRRQYLEARS